VKLGLLTACLPDLTLTEIADWAAAHDFEALEVAAWPDVPGRPFEAHHLDVANLDDPAAEKTRSYLAERGLEISALAYYENNLHPDERTRAGYHAHLRHCIDAAERLGCPFVGTFVGRDWTRSVSENLALAERELPPLVEYAGERGVRLIVENCPMEGWHPDGYPANLAYSPELWEWMFSLGFYLNYDPSHLTWLGIDPVAALRTCPDRVVHAQAKDVEIDPEGRNRVGVYGRAVDRSNPWDNGWNRFRVPGLGMIEWRRIVDALYQIGFEGVLSVEHEDPVWSGDPGRVLSGVLISHATLRPWIRRTSGDTLPLTRQLKG
jgi:sugar phosphate isomerase/epimerase